MILKDVNGVIHAITRRNIGWMLGAGWLFYFASFILNIIYYIIHPSFADISGPALVRRLTCGQEEGLEIETEMEKELDVEKRYQSTLDLGTQPDEEIPLIKIAKERFCIYVSKFVIESFHRNGADEDVSKSKWKEEKERIFALSLEEKRKV